MSTIRLNNSRFKLNAWDNPQTVLVRYAIEMVNNKVPTGKAQIDILPPGAYRFDPMNVHFQPEGVFKVKTLIESLDQFPTLDLLVQSRGPIETEYPDMPFQEITIVYLIGLLGISAYTTLALTEYMPRLNSVFGSANESAIFTRMKGYNDRARQSLDKASKDLKKQQKLQAEMEKIPNVRWTPFMMDSITMRFIVDYPKDLPLALIFDHFQLSPVVPFAVLVNPNGETLYHVHETFHNPEWVMGEYSAPGLYFYIYDRLAYWNDQHMIDIQYGDHVDTQTDLEEIRKSVDNLVPVTLVQEPMQIRVGGSFTGAVSVNLMLLLDTLVVSQFGWSHMSMNEQSKTMSNKMYVQISYTPDANVPTSKDQRVKAVMTHEVSNEGKPKFIVRVNSSPNVALIESFMHDLGKLVSMYKSQEEDLKTLYISFGGKRLLESLETFETGTKVAKLDTKTGKRLAALKAAYPDLYAEGYSRMCTKEKQPLVIPEDDVGKYRKKFGDSRIMAFKHPDGSTVHYGCLDPDNPNTDTPFVYPGLQKNVSKTKDVSEYLPCCYSTNQYEEHRSNLYKILTAEKGGKVKVSKRGGLGYIVKYNKQVIQESSEEHRYGLLPAYIKQVFIGAGVESSIVNPATREDIFPVVRMGLIDDGSSIIHALEYATSEMYQKMSYEQRSEHVLKVRRRLAKKLMTPIAQETVGLGSAMLKSILLDPSIFMDPRVWTRLLEDYYETSVYLFEISPQHPHGEILVPFSSGGPYIRKKYDQCVVLVVHEPKTPVGKTLVELVSEIKIKKQGPKHVTIHEKDSGIYIAMDQLYEEAYGVELVL